MLDKIVMHIDLAYVVFRAVNRLSYIDANLIILKRNETCFSRYVTHHDKTFWRYVC